MLDFFTIATRTKKPNGVEVYPKFIIKKSQDLMIRGGDFYAIWDETRGLWSTDEEDAINLIDAELSKYAEEYKSTFEGHVKVLYMWDAESGTIDAWHKYCQKQLRDSYKMLDEKLLFANDGINKKDYASKRLSYPLEAGECPAWEQLISTLYSEPERHKLEWAIGSIVSGESKDLQKFLVLYGGPGTGKSTVLNIVEKLFDGYCSVFDAKALGSANAQFALEPFKKNPLVAIQHDGDLSRIEDNTRLNSVVSHETMSVNEKHKSQYENRFICFLFMGTNRPVKITDAKSGILRRLIDVSPTGNKLSARDYKKLTKQINFELGAIAHHCKEIYLDDPGYYDDYMPLSMLGASNDFYNFMIDSYHVFKKEDGTTLKAAWEMYKTYVDDAKITYPLNQRTFKEELKNYFRTFNERFVTDSGERARSYYSGFLTSKFGTDESGQNESKEKSAKKDKKTIDDKHLIKFDAAESIFDKECANCLAQYASVKETPTKKWDEVRNTLSKLDTSKLHYVKVPENHIVIDFDIKDKDGNKSLEKNLAAASEWPATYAELSKSGAGIHLHYIYTGDVSKLSRIYEEDVEIKVFTGKSSLRRMLTKCNSLPIATISTGLPLRGDDKVVNWEGIKNEKMLRTMIKRNLNKEYHSSTKCSIDYIHFLLEEAHKSGIGYDVSDFKNDVFVFAARSSNQPDYCIKLVNQMKFKSEEVSVAEESNKDALVFYDCEVFPNLFLVNWKFQGKEKPVVRMINPTPSEIEDLLRYKLVGFNCRRYDNHMLYARMMGYTNEELYNLSQKIVNSKKGENRKFFFGEAYNLSYTDVYDYASKKQSLKKWEIELGIHHQELGLPWDQPVPEERWGEVAAYCDNDVIATEAVFDATQADFIARKIQVDLVRLLHGVTTVTVNDTTNTLSTKIIFGNNRKPQGVFNYRDLSQPVGSDRYEEYREKFGPDYKFRVFDADGLPLYRDYIPGEKLPDGWSILPFFKGYTFEYGKSIYMDQEIGEGGRVFANPGMHGNVWDGDISSQHPHSVIAEVLFGPSFTKVFEDIVRARVAVKHKDFEAAGKLLGGALKPYLNAEQSADLAQALKIVINSIYGLTSAQFENPFRDNRNKDNLVAKRGALFMTLLKSEVEKRGFTVAHIKTDSIKIPDATPEIQEFVTKFGKEFGYTFETEAVFEKFCLVNNAVYIAKFKEPEIDKATGEEIWWTATGAQFAVPYVFKKLFSKKPLVFEDFCEAKEVKSALYLDMNEKLPEGEHAYEFIGRVGNFCPIKPGRGGGELLREAKDKEGNVKYDSATGAKGYRWLESEVVKAFGTDDMIDRSYYDAMVDAAVDTIAQFGDFEWFASDDPYIGPESIHPTEIDTPPWQMPCGRDSCEGCPNFIHNAEGMSCRLGHDISDVILLNCYDDSEELFKRR